MSRVAFRATRHQAKVVQAQKKLPIVGIEGVILLLKAVGGHRFRECIGHSDEEVEKLAALAEDHIKRMSLRLIVAERILKTPAPSYRARWDEYEEKCKEVEEKEKKK